MFFIIYLVNRNLLKGIDLVFGICITECHDKIIDYVNVYVLLEPFLV